MGGRALRPLALPAVEQRFAARFPGAIARFSDGERACWCCAASAKPTRMLQTRPPIVSAALGWRIQRTQLERDAQQRLWRCFEAEGAMASACACERIAADDDGSSFVDASSWFWAAALGRSKGAVAGRHRGGGDVIKKLLGFLVGVLLALALAATLLATLARHALAPQPGEAMALHIGPSSAGPACPRCCAGPRIPLARCRHSTVAASPAGG